MYKKKESYNVQYMEMYKYKESYLSVKSDFNFVYASVANEILLRSNFCI